VAALGIPIWEIIWNSTREEYFSAFLALFCSKNNFLPTLLADQRWRLQRHCGDLHSFFYLQEVIFLVYLICLAALWIFAHNPHQLAALQALDTCGTCRMSQIKYEARQGYRHNDNGNVDYIFMISSPEK
jgi:hypothetical protein